MLMYFIPSEAIVPIFIGLIGHTLSDLATIIGVAVVGGFPQLPVKGNRQLVEYPLADIAAIEEEW